MQDFLVLNQTPEFKSIFSTSEKIELFFTHPVFWAGGATDFFNDLCTKKLRAGTSLLIISYAISNDEKPIWRFDERKSSGKNQSFFSPNLGALLSIYLPVIKRILVNSFNGLCFFSPRLRVEIPIYREITALILQLKNKLDCELVYFFHDFWTICPYLFLVSDQMKFCGGGENGRQCASCLKNSHPWTFEAAPELDITEWRECSRQFLTQCTKLVFFSLSTLNLLEDILPGVVVRQPEKISIMGQDLKSCGYRPVAPSRRDKLIIGVIGTIHVPKGIKQVFALRQYIQDQQKDAEIVLIGDASSNSVVPKEKLTVTGKYQRSDLPDLIRKHGVNVIFFSSIWPETYSRVASEVQELDMPLAFYPLGAPAERMRLYHKAMQIPDFSVENTYRTLEQLFCRFVKTP